MANYWNNGAALNDTELANARQWATGKSWGDIQGKAGSLVDPTTGLNAQASPDQLAQIFGATGQQVQDVGYGQAPGTPGYGQFDKWQYAAANDGSSGAWFNPQTSGGGGSSQQGNPYLDAMAGNITRQYTQNLNENILPGVRYGAEAAGGFGGSRQGIAEGKAIAGSNEGLAGALANLYGQSYESQQERDLRRYGIDTQAATARYGTDKTYDIGLRNAGNQATQISNQYDLGLRGDATQRHGIDTTASTAHYVSDNNLTGQLAGAAAQQAVGAGNVALGNSRLGWDQFVYQDQAPMRELSWLSDIYKNFSGLNNTTTDTGQSNGFANFLGGTALGSQILKSLGY